MQQIRDALAAALQKEGVSDAAIPLEHTADFAHGDYASSAALAFSKQLATNPRALAEKLVASMGAVEGVSKIEIAGPGFINFTLDPKFLFEMLDIGRTHGEKWGSGISLKGKKVMVEYTDPNPFKEFHIGHLMSNAIGESISRLIQAAGAIVVRANYQGDIGLHVAKAMYVLLRDKTQHPTSSQIGQAYSEGASLYESDEAVKTEINSINKRLYARGPEDVPLIALYEEGRDECLKAFAKIYEDLGTKFDHFFFESETGPRGLKIVRAHPEVFIESEGAVVFPEEKSGLHTRVFITSNGIPTYEAKELGLAELKQEKGEFDEFVYITASEQNDYFKVVTKAIGTVFPALKDKIVHQSHGMMRFADGKMSSRKGNVITGVSLIEDLEDVIAARIKETRSDNPWLITQMAVAAIKFQILKGAAGKDVIYDRDRALSTDGDSGIYLQYAHARTHAILEKAKEAGVNAQFDADAPMSELARILLRFYDTVLHAQEELEPHIVANYLISVAAAFNSWYAKEQILDGTPAAAHKVALTDIARQTLKNGLWLLGISAPERV